MERLQREREFSLGVMHAHNDEDAGLLGVGMADPLRVIGFIDWRGCGVMEQEGFCGGDVLERGTNIREDGISQRNVDLHRTGHWV